MGALQDFPRITPFLWFDNNAEEAVEFYMKIFKNSRRLDELRNTGDAPGPKGGVLTIAFELDGQKFTALNGGPAIPSHRPFHSWCDAIRRPRWMIIGQSSRREERKFSAGG